MQEMSHGQRMSFKRPEQKYRSICFRSNHRYYRKKNALSLSKGPTWMNWKIAHVPVRTSFTVILTRKTLLRLVFQPNCKVTASIETRGSLGAVIVTPYLLYLCPCPLAAQFSQIMEVMRSQTNCNLLYCISLESRNLQTDTWGQSRKGSLCVVGNNGRKYWERPLKSSLWAPSLKADPHKLVKDRQ